jgi:hypothetical protein
MSIQELSLKFKGILQNTDIQLSILIVVVSLSSFLLGRASIGEITPKIMTENQKAQVFEPKSVLMSEATPTPAQADEKTGYVASKNGTKYHLPWCGSAKSIKEENKVWFATKEEAEKAGYTPASNCKGI